MEKIVKFREKQKNDRVKVGDYNIYFHGEEVLRNVLMKKRKEEKYFDGNKNVLLK